MGAVLGGDKDTSLFLAAGLTSLRELLGPCFRLWDLLGSCVHFCLLSPASRFHSLPYTSFSALLQRSRKNRSLVASFSSNIHSPNLSAAARDPGILYLPHPVVLVFRPVPSHAFPSIMESAGWVLPGNCTQHSVMTMR